jgi:hypothetical protein
MLRKNMHLWFIIIIIKTLGDEEKRSGRSAEAMKQKNLISEGEVTLELVLYYYYYYY